MAFVVCFEDDKLLTEVTGVLYLSTIHTPSSEILLEKTTKYLLTTLSSQDGTQPRCLYRLYYEQKADTERALAIEGRVLGFSPSPVSLTFDDAILTPVQEAWKQVIGEASEEDSVDYMNFVDREGVGDEDTYE